MLSLSSLSSLPAFSSNNQPHSSIDDTNKPSRLFSTSGEQQPRVRTFHTPVYQYTHPAPPRSASPIIVIGTASKSAGKHAFRLCIASPRRDLPLSESRSSLTTDSLIPFCSHSAFLLYDTTFAVNNVRIVGQRNNERHRQCSNFPDLETSWSLPVFNSEYPFTTSSFCNDTLIAKILVRLLLSYRIGAILEVSSFSRARLGWRHILC